MWFLHLLNVCGEQTYNKTLPAIADSFCETHAKLLANNMHYFCSTPNITMLGTDPKKPPPPTA